MRETQYREIIKKNRWNNRNNCSNVLVFQSCLCVCVHLCFAKCAVRPLLRLFATFQCVIIVWVTFSVNVRVNVFRLFVSGMKRWQYTKRIHRHRHWKWYQRMSLAIFISLVHTARLSFYATVRVCLCVVVVSFCTHGSSIFSLLSSSFYFNFFFSAFFFCVSVLCCVWCAFFYIACVFGLFILLYGLMTTTISVCDTQRAVHTERKRINRCQCL